VLGLESTEKGLFGTKNLDSRTGRLGEVHERAGVGNEARTNKLANERSQIGRERLHAGGEIVAKVLAMSGLC
jgi:hypothetical protein|tara:strand:+ start:1682 stop:1897 length:216 start_codon:yes stop_codon:yes gene_type:complete